MEFLRRLIISILCAAIGAAIYWFSANQGMNVSVGPLFGLLLAVAMSALVIDAMIRGSVSGNEAQASTQRAPKPKSKSSSTSSGNREQGNVKWFNTNKGYGFIARDSGGEIFVHYRSIQGSGRRFLRDGQRVEFTVGEGEKGPQAEDVGVL